MIRVTEKAVKCNKKNMIILFEFSFVITFYYVTRSHDCNLTYATWVLGEVQSQGQRQLTSLKESQRLLIMQGGARGRQGVGSCPLCPCPCPTQLPPPKRNVGCAKVPSGKGSSCTQRLNKVDFWPLHHRTGKLSLSYQFPCEFSTAISLNRFRP